MKARRQVCDEQTITVALGDFSDSGDHCFAIPVALHLMRHHDVRNLDLLVLIYNPNQQHARHIQRAIINLSLISKVSPSTCAR